jgi:hypothetical protein
MRTKLCFTFLCWFCFCNLLFAQVSDTLSPVIKKQPELVSPDLQLEEISKEKEYVPRQALLWSIIPGGGQVYNRRWWKVPLVFSAFSGVAAVLDFNQSNYKRFKVAYSAELAGETHEFTGFIDSASELKVFRDNFDKSRQTNYFFLAGVYILQGVEAYVDTHLRNFDIDEDLSHWQVKPALLPGGPYQAPTLALALAYTF